MRAHVSPDDRSPAPASDPAARSLGEETARLAQRRLELREERARLEDRRSELREERLRLKSRRNELLESLASLFPRCACATALSASLRAQHLAAPKAPVGPAEGVQSRARGTRAAAPPDGKLSRSEQRVVDALAWLEMLDLSPARELAVASLTGYRVRTAGWVAVRRSLRRRGLVEIGGDAQLQLTESGRERASAAERPSSGAELHAAVLARLDAPERRILQALLEVQPGSLDVDALARRCRYDRHESFFQAAQARLRTLGLIVRPAPGQLRASDLLRCAAASDPTVPVARPRLLAGGLRFAPTATLGRTS